MSNLIRIGKRLVPVEHVALIEPFVHSPEAAIRTYREFKSRVVLLNRDSILSEDTTERLAELHSFRILDADGVATNPALHFSVEEFAPAENFRPVKNYATRVSWSDRDGNTQSKLLLTEPELVLAIVVRGNQPTKSSAPRPPTSRPTKRTTRRGTTSADPSP